MIKILQIFIFTLCLGSLCAQQGTTATGGSITGVGGTASIAVGQIVCETITDNAIYVEQGILHGFDNILTSNDLIIYENENFSLFPNPTSADVVLLTNIEETTNDFTYYLYDERGVLLQRARVQNWNDITLQDYTSGSYFLTIRNNKNEIIKASNIIKN